MALLSKLIFFRLKTILAIAIGDGLILIAIAIVVSFFLKAIVLSIDEILLSSSVQKRKSGKGKSVATSYNTA